MQLFDRRTLFCAGDVSVRQKESRRKTEICRGWRRKRAVSPRTFTSGSRAKRSKLLQIAEDSAKFPKTSSAKESSSKMPPNRAKNMRISIRLRHTASGLRTGIRLASGKPESLRRTGATIRVGLLAQASSRQTAASGSTELGRPLWTNPLASVAPERTVASGGPEGPVRSGAPSYYRKREKKNQSIGREKFETRIRVGR